MAYVPSINAFGELSALGDSIGASNAAQQQAAQNAYANALLSNPNATPPAPPQQGGIIGGLLSGLKNAFGAPPPPAPNPVASASPNPVVDAARAGVTPTVPPGPATAGGLTPAQTQSYTALRQQGLPDSAARAVVANLSGESGASLNPGPQNNAATDAPGALNANGAYGIASWNGPRQEQLLNFARQQGADPADRNTQLKFVAWDIQNNYPQLWKQLNDPNSSPQDNLNALVTQYERPADSNKAIAQRSQYLAGGYPAPAPGSAPIQVAGAVPAPDTVASDDTAPTPTAAPSVGTKGGMVTANGHYIPDYSLAQINALINSPITKVLGENLLKRMIDNDKIDATTTLTSPDQKSQYGIPTSALGVWQVDSKGKLSVVGAPAGAASGPRVVGPGGALVDPTGKVLYKGASDVGAIDPETTEYLAGRVAAGDPSALNGLGRGAQGSANILAVQKRAAELSAPGSSTPANAQTTLNNKAAYAGQLAGSRTAGQINTKIDTYARTANAAADYALQQSDNVPRGEWQPVNQLLQMADTAQSDPNLLGFKAAINTLVNEYARATGGGTVTVSGQDHAREMLNSAQGPEGFKAVVNVMKGEVSRAQQAAKDQLGAVTGTGQPSAVAAPVAPLGTAPTPAASTGPKLGSVPIAPSDVQLLRQGKGTPAQFDAVYGAGAAQRVLGPTP